MNQNAGIEDQEEKKERLGRKISFWLSMVLSIAVTGWYYFVTPPDDEATKQLRLFIAANVMEVTQFIKLERVEQKAFAERHSQPFYRNYVKASEVEKNRLNALVNISTDYKETQYWFNMVFLWAIAFTTFWFIGLMIEAVIVLMRRGKSKPSI